MIRSHINKALAKARPLAKARRNDTRGFLLPTVIALGLAIGTVSVMALQGVAQNSVTTNSNYYDSLAQEAAQAGVAMAQSCMGKNILTWTDVNPLKPNTGCNGLPDSLNKPSYVAKSDNYTSYFEVKAVSSPTTTTKVITSNGYVELKNPDGSRAGDRYTKTLRVLNRATVTGNVSKDVDSLGVGYLHACVAAEGRAYCWGRNANGQLGTFNSNANSNAPVEVDVNPTLIPAFAGDCRSYLPWPLNSTCAIWNDPPRPAHPASPLAGKAVTKVTAGNDHSCALTSDGRIYCWGDNAHGQLGDRTTVDSNMPVPVDANPYVPAFAGNCRSYLPWPLNSTCAVWNDPPRDALPASGLNGKTIIDIQAGQYYTCALTSDGKVSCWGENAYGQLGVNDRTDRNYPVEVYSRGATAAVPPSGCFFGICANPGSPAQPPTPLYNKPVKKLGKMSNSQHTCVITADDTPVCWGRNYGGQVGNDAEHSDSSKTYSKEGSCPTGGSAPPITTGSDAVQPAAIYMGPATTSGSWFWTSSKPASALQGKTIKDIQTTDSYTMVLGNDGRVYWWGGSTSTSTGNCTCVNKTRKDSDGNTENYRDCSRTITRRYHIVSRPYGPEYNGLDTCSFIIFRYSCGDTSIIDGKQFSLISGSTNTGTFCGLTGSDIYCHGISPSVFQVPFLGGFGPTCSWTGYRGQLGDAAIPLGRACWTTDPVRITMDGWLSGKSVVDIQSGAAYDWGTLFAWGDTDPGAFNCTLASKQVACWGANDNGQLGTGNNSNRNAPTAVSVDSPLGKPGTGSSFSEAITF